MDDKDLKQLDARLAAIESKLAGVAARPQATNLTEDEIRAYQKVRDVIAADFGDFCGINDCFRCIPFHCGGGGGGGVFRCIKFCINECICGPGGGFGPVAGGGFGGFGR